MSKSQHTIASEIRVELRSILRQLKYLRTPIQRFQRDPAKGDDVPRFHAMFDLQQRESIFGLRLGECNKVMLPDEQIIDSILELAKSTWHLKDRLRQWTNLTSSSHGVNRAAVEEWAKKSPELLICCDLTNEKKHGDNENRSGCKPTLAEVEFDTSQSGQIEYYCDRAIGAKELVVSNPVPITYRIPVWPDGGREVPIGEAIEIIERAMKHWVPLVRKLGLLDMVDPETLALRQALNDLMTRA